MRAQSLPSQAGAGLSVYKGETARIRNFDPAKAGDVSSALAVSKIYEGLVQYSYLDRPYRVIPHLAESMPEVSSNGLQYTFRLRKGVYFQDDPCFEKSGGRGREVTAEDFIYSFKRLADAHVGSSGYWGFRGKIAGLDDFRAATSRGPADYGIAVEGLQAPDRYTLQLKLTHADPALMWFLAMSYAAVVPREAVEFYGERFARHPVGTGPFVLESWSQNYRVTYVRNPKWKETGRLDLYPAGGAPDDGAAGLLADAGKPIPFLDRIEESVIGDPSTQWLLFLSGALVMSGISRDNWDAVMTDKGELNGDLVKKGIALAREPALDVSYLGFNMDDPVVGRNKALRQALTCAFDRERWRTFQNNRVIEAVGIVPPAIRPWSRAGSPFSYDVKRAAELLVKAGYPEGRDPASGRRLELTLELGGGDTSSRETAELLAHFMQQVGVVLRPSFNNGPAFFKKLEQRQAQVFLLGWIGDYPDAENFLQLFCSANVSPGINHCNYRNAEVDRLYDAAAVTLDEGERSKLYARMDDIIVEDCPMIFLHHSVSFGLRHAALRNFKPHNFPYGMIKYYRLAGTP